MSQPKTDDDQPREPAHVDVDVEVRYAETDQMGVVHHANFIVWFELARTRLCSLSGFHYAEIEEMGVLLVVTRVECRYLRPARFGETVRVRCWGEKLSSRGMRFAYEVFRGEEKLGSGATEHIWVDAESRKVVRMPDTVRAPFRRLAGLDPEPR